MGTRSKALGNEFELILKSVSGGYKVKLVFWKENQQEHTGPIRGTGQCRERKESNDRLQHAMK